MEFSHSKYMRYKTESSEFEDFFSVCRKTSTNTITNRVHVDLENYRYLRIIIQMIIASKKDFTYIFLNSIQVKTVLLIVFLYVIEWLCCLLCLSAKRKICSFHVRHKENLYSIICTHTGEYIYTHM